MSDFYAETRAIVESKASTLSKYTYDTYLSHLRKLQMYRPTAECRDITEAFVFGYVDFMHARKNSAGCIYREMEKFKINVPAGGYGFEDGSLKNTVQFMGKVLRTLKL